MPRKRYHVTWFEQGSTRIHSSGSIMGDVVPIFKPHSAIISEHPTQWAQRARHVDKVMTFWSVATEKAYQESKVRAAEKETARREHEEYLDRVRKESRERNLNRFRRKK